MEALVTPGYILTSDMSAANLQGLNGWSQTLGGQFNITGAEMSALPTNLSNTLVITQTQDVVYPKTFQTINMPAAYQCISDCPTIAQIGLYNLGSPTPLEFLSTAPPYGLPSLIMLVTPWIRQPEICLMASISGTPSGSPVTQTQFNTVYSGNWSLVMTWLQSELRNQLAVLLQTVTARRI